MALFSQCFAISAIVAPLAGGALLDLQNNGLLLWLIVGGACLAVLPALSQLKPRYSVNGAIASKNSETHRLQPINPRPANSREVKN